MADSVASVHEGDAHRDMATLVGELDLARRAEIEALSAGGADVWVDLSQVTFVDSTALGCLVGVRASCQARGGELFLVAPSAVMRRVLAASGLDTVFRIVGSTAGGVVQSAPWEGP